MLHLPTLFLQLIVVLCAARGVGFLFRKIHQPQVVGEMIAGILLGPSLLGWLAPDFFATLFPPDSLSYLSALSQFGLVIFMFLVGLELEPTLARARKRATLVMACAGVVIPFAAGAALAVWLRPRLSDLSAEPLPFALFLGTAMSVTAFPVLARILTERKLVRTELGSLALTVAGSHHAAAWCMLAGVVLLVRATGTAGSLGRTAAWALAYVLAMVLVVRPLLGRLVGLYERRGAVSKDNLAMVVVLVLGSAWATERLGLHAIFGAFLVGAIMPRSEGFARDVSAKLHDAAVVLLLPLFFAFTGLRTSVGLLRGSEAWLCFAIVVLVAVASKLGGTAVPGALAGLDRRTATSVGILVNTRGLMELLALSIGFELGLLSPTLFTMMVLMALLTTFMTAPLLEWVHFRQFYPIRAVDPRVEPARISR